MSDNIIQLNEDLIKHDLKDLVRSSVEETLNALLDHEADELVNASVNVNHFFRWYDKQIFMFFGNEFLHHCGKQIFMSGGKHFFT